MLELTRRQVLASLTVGGAATSTARNLRPPPQDVPLIFDQPRASLSHTLAPDGTLTVDTSECAYANVRAVLLSYPDATVLDVLQTTQTDQDSFEASVPLDTVTANNPVVCGIFARRTSKPVSEWQYLGETAPVHASSGLSRAYHETEQPSAHIEWPDQVDGVPSGKYGTVDRIEQAGRYRLEYTVRESPIGLTRSEPVTFDIGKTAYARSQQGQVRSPGAVFDEALAAPLGRQVLEAITEDKTDPSPRTVFNATVAFVQSIPYRTDFNSEGIAEYAKTPVETLVEGCGDCEDKAVLLAMLLSQPELDCETILAFPPKHASVAVKTDDIPEHVYVPGESFSYAGTEYTYVEATQPAEVGFFQTGQTSVKESDLLAIYDGSWSFPNLDLLDDQLQQTRFGDWRE